MNKKELFKIHQLLNKAMKLFWTKEKKEKFLSCFPNAEKLKPFTPKQETK